jgi:hypothetical protein
VLLPLLVRTAWLLRWRGGHGTATLALPTLISQCSGFSLFCIISSVWFAVCGGFGVMGSRNALGQFGTVT